MAWIPDLTSFTYCDRYTGTSVLAVGWLEREHEYRTGRITTEVLKRLGELCSDRQQWSILVYRGFHNCTLCPKKAPHGSRNLFVPGNGVTYACPELIVHYVDRHSYLPPGDFCQAVLECPDPGTQQYRERFLSNGGREYLSAVRGKESIEDWRL